MLNKPTLLPLLILPIGLFSAPLDFNREVRPILSDKCFSCHGPDEHGRKADLRLDLEREAKNPELFAIVEGKPEESEMIFPDSFSCPHPRPASPSAPGKRKFSSVGSRRGVGGTLGLPRPGPEPSPESADSQWAESWIDHFVLAHYEEEGLRPAPDADPVTLIRRLHFDLTGLPPTPETVRAYAEDPSAKAYAALIDQLLDSPHYGERMAAYWLDLVRFADTVGYHGDQPLQHFPLPGLGDRSLQRQPALRPVHPRATCGDLLPGSTTEQKVASGYNRLLQTTHEGGLQLKEYDAIYAADRVRNLSEVWMGTRAAPSATITSTIPTPSPITMRRPSFPISRTADSPAIPCPPSVLRKSSFTGPRTSRR